MKFERWSHKAMFLLLAATGLILSGCGQSQPKAEKGKKKPDSVAKKPDTHGEWWCAEHGIPEEDCSMCLPDDEVKTRFKDKGDWCDKHNRAMSQCFICTPKLKDKFAAQYRAKYGKEPPPIEAEEPKKEEPKKNEPKKG